MDAVALFAALLLMGTTASWSAASADHQIPCLVGMCTSRHSHLLEEHGTMPSASADYCLLLKDYLACLNDSFPTCLSQLDFHSAMTAASQRWRKFKCQRFEEKKLEELECQFWEEEDWQKEDYEYGGREEEEDGGKEEKEEGSGNSMGKCAIFGQLHLRPFHYSSSTSRPEQCNFMGARPLFDNRFFLIQITASPLLAQPPNSPKQVHAVSKIAIIIRPREGCVPGQKAYLADAADPGPLPGAFQDGTTKIGEGSSKKVLEIIVMDAGNRVDLVLNHLATTIRVRKFANKFLNIFVQSPKRLLHMHYESVNLCANGCWEATKKNGAGGGGQNDENPCEGGEEEEEEMMAKRNCSQLAWEWGAPAEWAGHCVHDLVAQPIPSMAQSTWRAAFRATLEDFFGNEAKEDGNNQRRRAEWTEDGKGGDGKNGCHHGIPGGTPRQSLPPLFPIIPLSSPISTSSSCPFPSSFILLPLLCLLFIKYFHLFF